MVNFDQKIRCLECGKSFTRPLSHVWQVHGLTSDDYKELHGLDKKRGITTESDREHMRELVFQNGTVNNLKNGAPFRFKKGDKTLGRYTRSDQTMKRLKQSSFIKNKVS